MAGGEQSRGIPTAVQTPGRKAGARAGRRPVFSPLYFRDMGFFIFPFFLQLNIEGTELYCWAFVIGINISLSVLSDCCHSSWCSGCRVYTGDGLKAGAGVQVWIPPCDFIFLILLQVWGSHMCPSLSWKDIRGVQERTDVQGFRRKVLWNSKESNHVLLWWVCSFRTWQSFTAATGTQCRNAVTWSNLLGALAFSCTWYNLIFTIVLRDKQNGYDWLPFLQKSNHLFSRCWI